MQWSLPAWRRAGRRSPGGRVGDPLQEKVGWVIAQNPRKTILVKRVEQKRLVQSIKQRGHGHHSRKDGLNLDDVE